MKQLTILTTFLVIIISGKLMAQENIETVPNGEITEADVSRKRKLNFFIVSKRKKGKLDLATRYNIMRTKIKSFLKPKKFVAITAANSQQAADKIKYRVNKNHATIGTIWFDSHGVYKKGYSLFMIGKDEISYVSLEDAAIRRSFEQLVPYTDSNTKLVIGSCYGGATYSRSSVDYKDTTRMNGDSLMIGFGDIFTSAKIYGSESWVMTKPGLFNRKKNAVAGFPKRKLFRDVCYRPAWENVGKWNEYNAAGKVFRQINHVALNSKGSMGIRNISYSSKEDVKKDIARNLSSLEPDLYK